MNHTTTPPAIVLGAEPPARTTSSGLRVPAFRRRTQILIATALLLAGVAGGLGAQRAHDSKASAAAVRMTEYERRNVEEFLYVLELERLWQEGALATRPTSPAVQRQRESSPWIKQAPKSSE